MSVVGVDIGEHSTYIAVAKQGGVEIISNDYSQRNTPTVVALGGRQRHMGVTAEIQKNLNVKNTVSNFKNILGRSYKDEYVHENMNEIGADVVELKDGSAGFKVSDKKCHPEQILAMMFTKVKDLVKSSEEKDITTCVVSVPNHFTEAQVNAVKVAAKIAKIEPVQIVSETSALALAYGRTKTNLPLEETNSHKVVFVDCGASSIQASVVDMSRDKAMVLATSSATSTGGKYFDQALLKYFVEEIEQKYKCPIRDNAKALNKLRIGVEKIKKHMSANSNKLPLQIDSLVEDMDINIKIDRETFERLIEDHLSEIKKVFMSLLSSGNLDKEQIHSVEIVGGSTRIPAVKKIIEDVFGMAPSSSLNADEAVAKGCCFHAASISDKFLTKQFIVIENEEANTTPAEPGHSLDEDMVAHFSAAETRMIKDDIQEICRQEAKNVLEEQLYKYRANVHETAEKLQDENEFSQIKEYFQQTEDWLYEEGEEASENKYKEMLAVMHQKYAVFQQQQEELVKFKDAEEKRKRMIDQPISERNEDGEEYCTERNYPGKIPKNKCNQEHHCEDGSQMYYSSPYYRGTERPRNQYSRRGNSWGSPMMQDPFVGYGSMPFGRSPFAQRSLFGW